MSKLKDQIVKDIKERVAILNALFAEAAKEGIEVYIRIIDHNLAIGNKTNMGIRVILKEIL